MSYSFGNVARDGALTNISTSRSVSTVAVADVLVSEIVDLPYIPYQVADNVVYINSVTGLLSRYVPIGGALKN